MVKAANPTKEHVADMCWCRYYIGSIYRQGVESSENVGALFGKKRG